MGIIAKQSIYNVLSIALAFIIGAFNMLFLYPTFLGKEFQGLIVALLANSNLIQPFVSFGVQHTLIKYFSDSKTQKQRDRLLWFSLLLPLVILSAIIPLYYYFNIQILNFLTNSNKTVLGFPVLILAIAISTAYFEIFFSWLRVHLQSIFGNFLKEVYPRFLTFILLISFAFELIGLDKFILLLIIGYYLRLLIIALYSFYVYTPKFEFKLPQAWLSMLRYSSLIFLSGAAASFILDIDKSMIYTLTSNENDTKRLEVLLKKSSTNLMIVSGFVFLIINLNLNDFYLIINQEGYSSAASVVIIVSMGKFFSMSMGCLNNIISNSKYYTYVFWFSIISAFLAIVLNYTFIESYGIIGAAVATLMVILFINSCKIVLVAILFKIHPYSKKSLGIMMSLIFIYLIIFNIPSFINPIISIVTRSLFILGLFIVPLFKFKWSSDIEEIFTKVKSRLF